MVDYQNLMIKGIKESVPRSNNSKLAFDNMQGKDETPATWLNRIKQNFRLYSNINPESPEGQVLLKTQFVTKSWLNIRRKLEKIEDWQGRGINELLREALKVYLRREEEKAITKAKVMVAVARESVSNQSPPNREDGKPCLSEARKEGVGHSALSSKPGIISITNQYNPCLSKDMRAAGPAGLDYSTQAVELVGL
ncbi:hypothetical protein HGM15179_021070 [Zosterops borbonicus]|uniref:Core shell protein Gag P30 domain-containing protein n=1 Tax=Zosterops borbonicus TaxID=364589 RepID=A0A8K1FWK9_9PASS|nr:hypothetical protein HGM15179_021070 [Zosterops borbonicus]